MKATNVLPCLLLALSCAPQSVEPAEAPQGALATETAPEAPYDRSEYGSWRDYDKDCQDTRQEVLIAESEVPVTFKDGKTCKVATGQWTCPYTGVKIVDPKLIDIDHMVPLREAHGSGGWEWERDKKRLYSNDLEDPNHLIAVTASSNRSKGSRDPAGWMPPRTEFWCDYLKAWVGVKRKWELAMDCDEARTIALYFEGSCQAE